MRAVTVRDLVGRNIVVTGSNTGIGRAVAEGLALRGARLWLACRSEERAQPALDAIRAAGGDARFHALDLGSLAEVRESAQTLLAQGEKLHVLVNNAGLAGQRGVTVDGFELAFGTNHLGHFLFTTLLLPRLRESTPARIVNVSSRNHYHPRRIDWEALRRPTRSWSGLPEYGVSKLCNVLFTKELARGRAGVGVHSCATHPGRIASDIWRRVPAPLRSVAVKFMRTNEEGALSTVRAAASEEVSQDDGLYYTEDGSAVAPAKLAEDPVLARELWKRSEEWTR